MKRLMSLTIIFLFISTTLISCNLKNENKKQNIDLSRVILAYRVQNFAWGEVNYAYIVNGHGQLKKVDLVNKKLNPTELMEYLQKSMADKDVPVLKDISPIPNDVFQAIENVSEVDLIKVKGPYGNDIGTFEYYSYSEKAKGGLVLIQALGDVSYKSDRKDVENLCKYIEEKVVIN